MIPLSLSPSLRGHLGYLPFPWLVGRSAGWRFCSHRGGRLGPELYPYSGLTLPYPYGGYANGRVSGRIGSRPLRSSAKRLSGLVTFCSAPREFESYTVCARTAFGAQLVPLDPLPPARVSCVAQLFRTSCSTCKGLLLLNQLTQGVQHVG